MNAIPEERMNRKQKILVVDDEKSILNMVSQMLERLGYEVTPCDDGNKAFQRFQGDPHAFDLIFTDMAMPGMSGEMLVNRVKQLRPEIPVILDSCDGRGGLDDTNGRDGSTHGAQPDMILVKPAGRDELINGIRFLLDKERP
jgi:CheY-like chemotaxis protein